MPKYNIIYTPADADYLWNGKSFDKIESENRQVLLYSGQSVEEEQVEEAVKECKEAVKKFFPGDADPRINKIKVKVS